MYDRTTKTLWQQFTGEPVWGTLVDADVRLTALPSTRTTWAAWRDANPGTLVLDIETGFERDYSPGAAYNASDELLFNVPIEDDRLAQKDEVFVLRAGDDLTAYPIDLLASLGLVNDALGRLPVVIAATPNGRGARAYQRGDLEFVAGDPAAGTLPVAAWAEGDNIPWSDPAFSQRMLAWHLRQDSDAASRPTEKIEEQVRWIHGALLEARPTRILELACGPGLYANRLAKLGHDCRGIDFAPAAIAYARDVAQRQGLACSYDLADLREIAFDRDLDPGFGLIMMISGQLNVFRRREAHTILERAFDALTPGGRLLLEPQRLATVVASGNAGPSWYAVPEGLFSDRPHLQLREAI